MSARTFDCTVLFDASTNSTITADTPEEAAAMAEDQCEGHQHLCNQCAKRLDTGDSIGVLVYENGEEVADTRYEAVRLKLVTTQRDELLTALKSSRSVLATALKSAAPDMFATDADVAEHLQIKRMDAAIKEVEAAL